MNKEIENINEQLEQAIKKNLPEKQDVSKAVKGSQHKFAILGHNKCLDEINTELIADEVLKVVDVDRIDKAVEIAIKYGQIDGGHHKMWVIDQMIRILLGNRYEEIINESKKGEDGDNTYGWDIGIAP